MLANLKQFILGKTFLEKILPLLLLLAMFLIALASSAGFGNNPGDSGTVDEIAHIPSGYTYVKDLDYRLNPEHPPLAKAMAGASTVLAGLKGPETDWSWNAINQWEAGWYMIYESGNNPSAVFFWARLPMMLLMVLLGYFIYRFAKEKLGNGIALAVLSMYVFYPDILAHGRLVTTDIAAALGFVITIYFFDKALVKRDVSSTLISGLAFGLAQLLKFSSFLLFFILLALAVTKALIDREKEIRNFWKLFWQNFKTYFWVCLFSIVIVWAVYIPFTWHTPPAIEHQLIEMNLTNDARTLPLRNFEHSLENNPVLRGLGHYLLGIMLVVARVEGGNNTFILGHLSDKSISWYFPVAWLLKTPLPIIILFISALTYLIVKWPADKKEKWFLAMILAPFLVYWAFTLKGSLNIGIRHLIPTVPFVLLLIGYFIRKNFAIGSKRWLQIIIIILLIYLPVSTLLNYPNFIAYFNELTPRDQRYQRLVDSSLDWGQDLLRLKQFVDDNNIDNIKVDYFGGSVPSYYLPQAVAWHSEYGPTTGWLAISATFYQSSKLAGPKEHKWSYEWLDDYRPVKIIGGSILIFHITPEELGANPPISPYSIVDNPVSGMNPIFQKN